MFPSLTVGRAGRPSPRVLLGATTAGVLAFAAIASSFSAAPSSAAHPALADVMRPTSWAMTIPNAWLAAPLPRARPGDAFDILALRSGERAVSAPVAYAVVLLATDDRGVTVQVDEDDAVALANARGSGMLLVVLLRSTR